MCDPLLPIRQVVWTQQTTATIDDTPESRVVWEEQ